MEVRAGYFDGRTALRREVLLSLDGDVVRLQGEGVEMSYPAAGVTVTPAVGTVRRAIRLPDGGICEPEDDALAVALERMQGKGKARGVLHRWERSLPLALAALALTVAAVLLFLRFGVPALARQVAHALPPAVEQTLGRESLATLDRLFFRPSRLPAERRAELAALFRRVAGSGPEAAGYRLEFRSSPALGANALALPSGIVVMTDALAELAESDDGIAGVLAHEIGHVRARHALRHVLQNSLSGLLIAALTGDLLSVTSLSAALPTALVDASFSREFEREADGAAIAWMKSAGVAPRRYAEMLGRLQARLDARGGQPFARKNAIRNYLSTHPDTGERIRRILAAEPAPP